MVTKKLEMDLARKGIMPVLHAVQGDSGIALRFTLLSDGEPWVIPGDAQVVVQYGKDGVGGTYDTLPDGTPAWESEGNILTVFLAPRVCTLWGDVSVQVAVYSGEKRVSTFTVILQVEKTIPWEREPENYTNLTQWLLTHENADAEVMDMRTGWDGKVYDYAGDALRGQIGELWTYMPEAITAEASGNFIKLTDSAHMPVRDLKAYIASNTKGVNSLELSVCGKNIANMKFARGNLQDGRAWVRVKTLTLPYASANEGDGVAVVLPCKAGVTYIFSANMALPKCWVVATVYSSAEDIYTYKNAVATHEDYAADIEKGFNFPCKHDGVMVALYCWKWSNGTANKSTFPEGFIPYIAAECALSGFEEPDGNSYTVNLPEACCGGYVDFGGGKYVKTHALENGEAIPLSAPQEQELSGLPRVSTRYPLTTIFSDGGDVEVSYRADTKKYIDRKFDELAAAIVAGV